MKRSTLLILGCVLVTLPAAAKDFWQQVYGSWSRNQCEKMLHDSPWAKQLTFGHPMLVSTDTGYSPEMHQEASPEITYFVQLRSARPLREALVRQQQIEQHYDHMSDAQKHVFDSATEKFLAQAFPDVVVVHVEYTANAPLFLRNLENYWQTVDIEAAKQSMFLIVPGKGKISPLKVILGKGDSRAFEMIFPRQMNGQPLLSSDVKSFAVVFQAPPTAAVVAASSAPVLLTTRVYAEFKPSKMMFESKLEY